MLVNFVKILLYSRELLNLIQSKGENDQDLENYISSYIDIGWASEKPTSTSHSLR